MMGPDLAAQVLAGNADVDVIVSILRMVILACTSGKPQAKTLRGQDDAVWAVEGEAKGASGCRGRQNLGRKAPLGIARLAVLQNLQPQQASKVGMFVPAADRAQPEGVFQP